VALLASEINPPEMRERTTARAAVASTTPVAFSIISWRVEDRLQRFESAPRYSGRSFASTRPCDEKVTPGPVPFFFDLTYTATEADLAYDCADPAPVCVVMRMRTCPFRPPHAHDRAAAMSEAG
jgi:hypothetical protein